MVHLIKLPKKILLLWKLKAEVNKLDIKVLFNVPTGLNNLKTKVDDLDVGELKTVPIDLKQFRAAVSKEVVKKAVDNKVNTKLNNLENKIPDAYISIQTNQYNTDAVEYWKR